MTDEQFTELKTRLDVVAGLLVLLLPKDREQRDLLLALDRLGASTGLIGQLLGMTRNNVNVSLHRARKNGNKKPRASKQKNCEVS